MSKQRDQYGLRYTALELGALPVEMINQTIGTELEPGNVRVSSKAHQHIAEDHAEDYQICIAALPQVIADPSFIGQAPGHAKNFELVKRVAGADGRAVLVAIGLERDRYGDYSVRSAYVISTTKIQNRRSQRLLKQAVR